MLDGFHTMVCTSCYSLQGYPQRVKSRLKTFRLEDEINFHTEETELRVNNFSYF